MMKKFLLVLVCVFFSCKEKQAQEVKVIDVKAFAELISSKNVQLLDVRTPGEIADGKITNAIEIDFFSKDFKEQISKLNKDKPIAVYCKFGGRSNRAAHMLHEMGFKEVYDLDGGYTSWKEKR